MRKRNSLLMTLPLLALAGCGGKPIPVPADKCAYVGEWTGIGMQMRLKPDGQFDYLRASKGSQAVVRAPLIGFDGDDLRVGQWVLVSHFHVSAPPHQDADGNWKMTFEGVELTRGAGAVCGEQGPNKIPVDPTINTQQI
jgi:predicted small lipoprotein YifL